MRRPGRYPRANATGVEETMCLVPRATAQLRALKFWAQQGRQNLRTPRTLLMSSACLSNDDERTLHYRAAREVKSRNARHSSRPRRSRKERLRRFAGVAPLQQLPECRAAMAVARLFFRAQFSESLLNPRKIKQRIVAEAVRAPRRIQNRSLSRAAKCRQRLAIASHREHAHESSRASLRWSISKFSQDARVVRLIVGIFVGEMG